MTAMMRSLGMMLSMGAVLVVFALIMGSTAVTPTIFPEFLKSLHLIFLAFRYLLGLRGYFIAQQEQMLMDFCPIPELSSLESKGSVKIPGIL